MPDSSFAFSRGVNHLAFREGYHACFNCERRCVMRLKE